MRALVIASLLLVSSSALAATGRIRGQLRTRIELGHFCDTSIGMECFAAMFTASQSNSQQPSRDAKVSLLDQNQAVIGFGSTDVNGNFNIRWTRTPRPTKVWVVRWYTEKSNRFMVTFADGAEIFDFVASTDNPPSGGTRNIGTWDFPFSFYANVYEAARMSWANILRFSNDMDSKFKNIQILMHQAATVFNPSSNSVSVADVDVRRTSAIQHELGHAVQNLQKAHYACNAFNYPKPCKGVDPRTSCTGGHNLDESEHYCASFEEGFADFVSLTSIYAQPATTPIYCNYSFGPCGPAPPTPPAPNGGWTFMEPTKGVDQCTTDESHLQGMVGKYLWDVYDDQQDPTFDDNTNFGAWLIFDHLDLWPDGTGNGQVNEPWTDTGFVTLDNPDGRTAADLMRILFSSVNTANQFEANCNPGI